MVPTPAPDSESTEVATRTTTDAAIEAEGVEVVYGDGTRAVDGIDLRVPAGEFFGFLGPNGAGKTTTIKTLVTLLHPTGGSITVNGFDVVTQSAAVRETVGYMAQETSVDPELTARENLLFACRAYGVPAKQRRGRIDDLLELIDLADVADKRAEEFSGGMQKRLDAGMALVHEPPLVFLDEPTTGLDPSARNRLWDYFRAINDRGTTVFLTTQYLEEADELCDRIGVIENGRIVADGSPAELKRRVGGEVLDVQIPDGDQARERAAAVACETDGFAAADVTTTEDGIAVTTEAARTCGPDLLVALRNEGVTVTGFDVRAPTLDDVFLAITDAASDAEDNAEKSETEPETGAVDPAVGDDSR